MNQSEGDHVEFDTLMSAAAWQAPATERKRPLRLQARRYARVQVSAAFEAPPERVFDAWVDPEVARQWLFATAARPMTSVTIHARASGTFRFVDRSDGEHIEHTGAYSEIVRPGRLAFTLRPADCAHVATRVAVEIVPRNSRGARRARTLPGVRTSGSSQGCELFLTHEEVPSQFADRIEARWAGMMYGLGLLLAARSG
jgi:uncharacterized protein YndB with AHSA1/START domain